MGLLEQMKELVGRGLTEEQKQTRLEWSLAMHEPPVRIMPVHRDRAALGATGSEPLDGVTAVRGVDRPMWQMDRVDLTMKLDVDGREVDASLRLPMENNRGGALEDSIVAAVADARDIRIEGRMAQFEMAEGTRSEFQIDSLVVDGRQYAMGLAERKAQDAWLRDNDVRNMHPREIRDMPEGWRAGMVKGMEDRTTEEVRAQSIALAAGRSGAGR